MANTHPQLLQPHRKMCTCSLIDLKAYLNYLKNGSWDGRATTQKMVVGIEWVN